MSDKLIIEEVLVAEEKAKICNKILRALPSWFEVEASIVGYTNKVKKLPFLLLLNQGKRLGLLL